MDAARNDTETFGASAPSVASATSSFCVASLNVGDRTTNPLEFVMDGDDSEIGAKHATVMARLLGAMNTETFGPGSLSADEREAVASLLSEFEGSGTVGKLLLEPTWTRVYEVVRRDCPAIFNALNLATLHLGRPSVLGATESCREFRDVLGYIAAWRSWYMDFDRAAVDAGRNRSLWCEW